MSTEQLLLILRLVMEVIEDERRLDLLEKLMSSYEWDYPPPEGES